MKHYKFKDNTGNIVYMFLAVLEKNDSCISKWGGKSKHVN